MNDVKMMLGKRAAQYYLFLTWCIVAPILMLVSRIIIDEIFEYSSVDHRFLEINHFETIEKSSKCWFRRISISKMEYGYWLVDFRCLYYSYSIILSG